MIDVTLVPAVTAPGETNGPIGWPEVGLSLVVTVGTVVIMLGGLILIGFLWYTVFGVLSQNPGRNRLAENIIKLLGHLTIGGKIGVSGAGLLGTFAIMYFCVLGCRELSFKFNSAGRSPNSATASEPKSEGTN